MLSQLLYNNNDKNVFIIINGAFEISGIAFNMTSSTSGIPLNSAINSETFRLRYQMFQAATDRNYYNVENVIDINCVDD